MVDVLKSILMDVFPYIKDVFLTASKIELGHRIFVF